jgi:DNA-directed RNA polymerase subunit RPC12/RpoP
MYNQVRICNKCGKFFDYNYEDKDYGCDACGGEVVLTYRLENVFKQTIQGRK